MRTGVLQIEQIIGALEAALGHADAVRRTKRKEALDPGQVHLKGVQVPGVDAQEPCPCGDRVRKLPLVMGFHQRFQPGQVSLVNHGGQVGSQDPGDERPARAVGPGHLELDGIRMKSLQRTGTETASEATRTSCRDPPKKSGSQSTLTAVAPPRS